MNEKNKTTGGEHNAERPIKIQTDGLLFKRLKSTTGKTGEFVSQNIPTETLLPLEETPMSQELELTLPEALRVIEETVKFLNKKNNEVQEVIHEEKLLDKYKYSPENLESSKRIEDSKRSDKDIENEKIVNKLLDEYKGLKHCHVGHLMKFSEKIEIICYQATGKDIKDL